MNASKAWYSFAVEDLKMAKLAMKEGIYNQVCFHSQQAVEKSIKSYLEFNGVVPPKTHKLADLISITRNGIFKSIKENIILLDRFYIPTRYPAALPGSMADGLPSKEDALASFKTAEDTVKKVTKLFKG